MKVKIGILLILILNSTRIGYAINVVNNSYESISEEENSEIQFFEGTWEEALLKAKNENKLIFLDAYASWCGPCKIMARTTFKNQEVAEYFNANFINVKMDMEKHVEGPRLSTQYKLVAYPTLYFLNSDESIFYQTTGMYKAKQFLKLGKSVLKTR